MTFARSVLAIFVVLSGVSAVGYTVLRGGHAAETIAPAEGELLAYDSTIVAGRQLIAHIDAHPDIDHVRGAALLGDTVVLLFPSGWMLARGSRVLAAYGSGTRGAPDAILRATRLAVRNGHVFVLDWGTASITQWSASGELLHRWSLPATTLTVGEDLAVEPDGDLLLSAQAIGGAVAMRWVLQRFGADGQVTTLHESEPNEGIAGVFRFAPADSSILLVDATTHTTLRLHASGEKTRKERWAAPMWTTPDSARTKYEAMLNRMPPAIRAAYRLPKHIPSLMALGRTESGNRLFQVSPAGASATFVEVFTPNMDPLGRTSRLAMPAPIFLDPAGILSVTETPSGIRVELLRVR